MADSRFAILMALFLPNKELFTQILSCSTMHENTKKTGKIIYSMKEMLYEVRYLKSSEDMILALTGQFKQLSHEPEYNCLNCPVSARIISSLDYLQCHTKPNLRVATILA